MKTTTDFCTATLPTFVIVRVSAEDQLKGYGPDVQWEDDIIPNAPGLGLSVDEAYRRIIQESATKWERTIVQMPSLINRKPERASQKLRTY